MCNSKPTAKDFKPILNKESGENEIHLTLLSDVTGISESQLSRYLNGIDLMTNDVVIDLFELLMEIHLFLSIEGSDRKKLPEHLRYFLDPSNEKRLKTLTI